LPSLVLTLFHSFSLPFFFSRLKKYFVDFSPFSYQFTFDRILEKLQKPDKSPGENGIVSEFYRHYWYLIGEDFESVVREIFDQKLLLSANIFDTIL
jgi:hypothetical protein